MNIRQIVLSIAAVISGAVAFGSAIAAEAVAEKPAANASGTTHESRSAERKKIRAANKEAVKKGEIAKTGEASAEPAAPAASGTHATRSAERKKIRAANKDANKKGELPGTNEAGETKK